MAWGNFVLDRGFDTAAAVGKRRAVKLTTTEEQVTQVAASTDIVVGVEQFGVSTADIARGKGCSVRVIGVTEWEAGGPIAIGQEVMADTSGRCILAATTGNRVSGLCVGSPTTNAGDVATVLLYQGGRVL